MSSRRRGNGKKGKPKTRPGKRERMERRELPGSGARAGRARPPAPGEARSRGRDDRPERGDRPREDNGADRKLRLRADGGRVCVVTKAGKLRFADPFFSSGERVVLPRGTDVADGTLVLVRPTRDGRTEIVEQLGDPEAALDVIAALLRERDFDPAHTRETLEAAEAAVRAPDPFAATRRDLTGIATFTIDPETAKDFDDAISAERVVGGALVRVHIADVTSFVRSGDPVDVAGRERATSTYVPGLVSPMLPPQLADDACSLVPGADRRAVTVEMTVREGRCERAEVYRSTIRSDARLTYEQVDAIFAGTMTPDAVYAEPLAVARDVAAQLLLARPHALELDIPEPQFKFDPSGAVIDQEASEHTESHRLIEQLMVLANEQVARILDAAGAPALYRIHERPEPTGAEKLVAQMISLGVPTPPLPDELTPLQATEVVAECSREIAEVVRLTGKGRAALPLLVLRALKVALYDPDCRGHAGLGLTHYCHFTSPIRRYPDIVCHRAVLALAERGEAVVEGELKASADDRLRADDDPLVVLGGHCSDQERASMNVEREADRIAKAFLLRDRLRAGGHGEVWRGEVTGMIQPGMFVNFGGGFDGMVPLRALKGDWWEMNPEGTAFYGERSGAMVRLGDDADVIVDEIDVIRGRVSLVPMAIGGDLDADGDDGDASSDDDGRRRTPGRR